MTDDNGGNELRTTVMMVTMTRGRQDIYEDEQWLMVKTSLGQ